MIAMTPQAYFCDFVEENLREFKENEHSVRHAMNAALTAFQMADIMFGYYMRHDPTKMPFADKGAYLMHLEGKCSSFVAVQSVATAYKHLYLQKMFYALTSAGAVYPSGAEGSQDGGKGLEILVDEESIPEVVVYQDRNGDETPLLPQIQFVADMWRSELTSLE